MRAVHPIQPTLPLAQVPHKQARTLAAIAQILDGLPDLEAQVLSDLVPPSVRRDVGRQGLSAQQTLRCLVLYLLLRTDFEQLRWLRRAQKMVPMSIPNHGRRVKRRVGTLRQEKLDDEERAALYFDLLQDTKRYVEAALLAAEFLDGVSGEKAARLGTSLRAQAENALCICDQAERRVLDGQAVAATDKRVSMFETHADILTKRNQVVYGHKVWVSFGKSGVVLAADILRKNPADATLAKPTVEQTRDNTGRTPHEAAMDLGFASKANVKTLKELGVQRVGFPAGRGIDGQAACGSRRVQQRLYRFRAEVEGLISWLKRALHLGRSRWKGEQGFCAYVFGVVLVASLQALATAR